VDFSYDIKDAVTAEECLRKVGKGILAHGVTSFLPTLVTSARETYHKVLPHIGPKKGDGEIGANRLGAHLEGPFISLKKKGAHNPDFIRDLPDGFLSLKDVYGPHFEECTRLVTLAPEKDPEASVVAACSQRGVGVSVGHSAGTLCQGEQAVRWGARLITHLFNAMTSFHHRDPGLLGLLTSTKLAGQPVFYGLIADGHHTHPAAVRIAYRTNFESMCLVTDAVCGLGLEDGLYQLGSMPLMVEGERAFVAGTQTLCGAIVDLFKAVKKVTFDRYKLSIISPHFQTMHFARCTLVEALEAASLHPAQALGIENQKGTLDFGADADFVMIDEGRMEIISTWIAGKRVYKASQE